MERIMVSDRKRTRRTLALTAVLSSIAAFGACDDKSPVEPRGGTSAARGATANEAIGLGGIEARVVTGTVYSARLVQAQMEVPTGEARAEVLSIPDLPAGQYIIMGHVSAANFDRSSWTSVTCFLMRDATDNPRGIAHTFLAESRGGGVNPSTTIPLTGEAKFSGPGKLSLECRQHPLGSARITGGWGGLTQIIATRVG
jgi:hypothetical protein